MTCRPNAFQKRIHRFLMLKSVSAFMAKVLHHADAFLLRLTSGRHAFTELAGLPVLQLTMRGAKTGRLRTLTLVSLPDDGKFALIATNFGQRQNPGWYYNLKANPECQAKWKRQALEFLAREASDEEYDKYWRLAVLYYEGYEKYKERAPRKIPIIVLEPKK